MPDIIIHQGKNNNKNHNIIDFKQKILENKSMEESLLCNNDKNINSFFKKKSINANNANNDDIQIFSEKKKKSDIKNIFNEFSH